MTSLHIIWRFIHQISQDVFIEAQLKFVISKRVGLFQICGVIFQDRALTTTIIKWNCTSMYFETVIYRFDNQCWSRNTPSRRSRLELDFRGSVSKLFAEEENYIQASCRAFNLWPLHVNLEVESKIGSKTIYCQKRFGEKSLSWWLFSSNGWL